MRAKKQFTVAAVYLSAFAGMFFITSRAVILPTVLTERHAENYYNIAVIIMSLSMCVVLPMAGKMSDIYGRKRICIVGSIGFLGSTALCLISVSIAMYLIGLALSGIFFGLINSVQLAFLHDLFDEEHLTAKVSNITIANSLACLLGPLVSGFFTDCVSWRGVYLSLLPIQLYMVMAFLLYREEIPDNEEGLQERKDFTFDWKGVLFFVAMLLPAMLLLSGKKIKLYETPVLPLVLLGIMAVGSVGFVVTEKSAKDAFVPFSLFKNRKYTYYIVIYLVTSIGFAAINYLPVYYQQIRGVSVLVSSLLIMPRQLTQIVTGAMMKKTNRRIRNMNKAVITGLFCMAAAFLCMVGFEKNTPLVWICLVEIGFGFANSLLTIISQSDSQKVLPAHCVGSGTSLIGFTGAFGNTLGAGIGGLILGIAASSEAGLQGIFLVFLGITLLALPFGWREGFNTI